MFSLMEIAVREGRREGGRKGRKNERTYFTKREVGKEGGREGTYALMAAPDSASRPCWRVLLGRRC